MPTSAINFLRVNPDGTVSATFPGGILLPVPNTAQGVLGVRFTKAEAGDNNAIGYLEYSRFGTSNELQLWAQSDAGVVGGNTFLSLIAHSDGASEIIARGKTVVNSSGASSFGQAGTVSLNLSVGRQKYFFNTPANCRACIGTTSNSVPGTVNVWGGGPAAPVPTASWFIEIETNVAMTVQVVYIYGGV